MTKLNIILPENDPMNGYFAFYRDFDKKYCSRYQIKSAIKGNISNIYSYNETPESSYFRVDDELLIHFKHSFALTNYSFSTTNSNSHPTAWKVYGYRNKRNKILIDTRSEEYMCGKGIRSCSKSITRTFKTDSYDSFNNYVFVFENNTYDVSSHYAVLRSMELFGIVHQQTIETCSMQRKRINLKIVLFVLINS